MCAEEKAQHVKYGYFAPVPFPLLFHLLLIPPATAFVVDYSFISNGAKKLMSNMDSPVTCSLFICSNPPVCQTKWKVSLLLFCSFPHPTKSPR